jgi:hemoglobin
MMNPDPSAKGLRTDLDGRAGIERLVNAFYERVQRDELLGFIFDDIARIDWPSHLPKMYAFWEKVLFGSGNFRGNPLVAHMRLGTQTPMGLAQFERWIALFKQTVDSLFAGDNAEHIKRCAEDMAHVIHARVNNVPDARFDPARLTPEQRERYATYRSAEPTA